VTAIPILLCWLSLLILGYAYVGYPLIVLAVARTRRSDAEPSQPPELPSVSVVIAVQNEAELLEEKLRNTAALEYPAGQLEIIVAADGPPAIIMKVAGAWKSRGVQTCVTAPRRGKTAAQNAAAARATGEVLVFTDVSAEFAPDVLQHLVRPFALPGVGCTTGTVAYREPKGRRQTAIHAGSRLRLRSELALRANQSRAGVLFGATGCIYAVRADLFAPVREDLVNDFTLPLKLLERGHRTVYVPEAVATIGRITDARSEFARRSRIVLQCMRALWEVRGLGNPGRRGTLIALTFWHRLLRWLAPLFLITVLASSLALSGHALYHALLIAQLTFLALAVIGTLLSRGRRRGGVASAPAYFLWVNLAALAGLLRLLSGKTGATWEPTGGSTASGAQAPESAHAGGKTL
jgi:cellulose synthase/poly-beta-1,6-N-acetylglucosamine synthase-like glycosyltransferase